MQVHASSSELAKHGLKVDCVAWYPWIHTSTTAHNTCLALDSCGIFYIGGNVDVTLPWSITDVPVLTAPTTALIRAVPDHSTDYSSDCDCSQLSRLGLQMRLTSSPYIPTPSTPLNIRTMSGKPSAWPMSSLASYDSRTKTAPPQRSAPPA